MSGLTSRFLRHEHDCLPPSGVQFDRFWTCPDCGDKWELIERANVSEWIRQPPTPADPPVAPKKPRARRRGQWKLGPIRLDLFVIGCPWWLPLDRR